MAKRGRPASHLTQRTPAKKKPALKRQNATVQAMVLAKPAKRVFDLDWKVNQLVSQRYLEESLNLVAIGGGKFNRIGNRITVCNVNVRGYLQYTFGATETGWRDQYFRVTLYHDKQSNGATYTSDVMEDLLFQPANGVNVSGDISVQLYRNYERIERFEIIHDETYKLESHAPGFTGITAGNYNVKTWFNISKKVKIPILYETKNPPSASPGMDEIMSSNIGMLITCTAVSSDSVTANFATRIKYYDN